jgi:hypothetical protein
VFVNTRDVAGIGRMDKSPDGNAVAYRRSTRFRGGEHITRDSGDPANQLFCQQPPWAHLIAISATAGGLVFIGGTIDGRFGAFESKTGKALWETRLDVEAHTNPITYMVRGKQYVVIVSSGIKRILA